MRAVALSYVGGLVVERIHRRGVRLIEINGLWIFKRCEASRGKVVIGVQGLSGIGSVFGGSPNDKELPTGNAKGVHVLNKFKGHRGISVGPQFDLAKPVRLSWVGP